MGFPQKKTKIELLYNSVIPLLGIYSKEFKSGHHTDTYTPCLLQQYSQQPRCPTTDEWIKKIFYIYIYTYTHTVKYYPDK
jgi:hypothetical protein